MNYSVPFQNFSLFPEILYSGEYQQNLKIIPDHNPMLILWWPNELFHIYELLGLVSQGKSKVIKLNIRKEPVVTPKDKEKMFKIIKYAFTQKRKTLLNSLTNNKIFENKQQGIEILNSLQINENCRPEELTLEQFKKISDNL